MNTCMFLYSDSNRNAPIVTYNVMRDQSQKMSRKIKRRTLGIATVRKHMKCRVCQAKRPLALAFCRTNAKRLW